MALPGRSGLRRAGLREGDLGRGDRPQRAAQVEPRGAARGAVGACAARRGLPGRRVPARAVGAAAHGRRRRRHQERGDRGGVDRRQGRPRPGDAADGRPLPAVRLLVARRLHHARATRPSSGRAARRTSTAARSRRSAIPRRPTTPTTPMPRRGSGHRAERRAVWHYRLRGYRILAVERLGRRQRARPGRAPRPRLVFVEVKEKAVRAIWAIRSRWSAPRSSGGFGGPPRRGWRRIPSSRASMSRSRSSRSGQTGSSASREAF